MSFLNFKLSLKKALDNQLLRVSSLTAVSTGVKILTSFLLSKVLAVSIGPSGLALVGQLVNCNNILLSLSTGGISYGVTKYFAECQSHSERKEILNVSFTIVLIFSALVFLVLSIFSEKWSYFIFGSSDYVDVVILMGGSVILYSYNNIVLAAINGLKLFRHYVKLNIINSILGLLITLILLYFFELKGVLIATVTYQSFVFFATLFYVKQVRFFPFSFSSLAVKSVLVKKLIAFSLMSVFSMIIVSLVQILIRTKITETISLNSAGIWEALNRLSSTYLLFATTSISAYYLPKLSEEKNELVVWDVIVNSCRTMLPLVLGACLSIYFSRDLIISLLFDSSFMEMRDLFVLQITGDFFKIFSWMFAFVMWAKRWTRLFIATEFIFSISYLVLCQILISYESNLNGYVAAYAINYFIYTVTMFWIVKKRLYANSVAR